ncbi:MAG: ABC transporter substrate-binding protein [Eubacteriales bacterium]|nr:ABC transporter substrate-binding protein [Eubacteriales bacterium]
MIKRINRQTKLAWLALMLLTALVLSACAAAPLATTTAPTATAVVVEAPSETIPPLTGFPIEITDATGTKIVINEAPQAIIATSVWAGEMLLDLVEVERIVGLSAWGDDPVLSATADQAAAVSNRVDISTPETIVALQPDLVIIDTFSDPDGSLTKTLNDAGVQVIQLKSPTDFTMIADTLTVLAQATGEIERGTELVNGMQRELQAVADLVATIPADQKATVMYYEDYYDATGNSANMLCAYGVESPFDAIAAAAGVVNVCDAATYSAVAKEKVVGDWQPDLLVIPSMQFDANFKAIDDQGETLRAAIKLDPILATLPAVQNDKIIAITDKYRGSTSQYMALSVRALAQAAYPDLFK